MAKKKEEQTTQEEQAVMPLIIGGICEFCGIPAKDCPHFKEIFSQGVFTCLCQHNLRSASAFQQSRYLYVEGVGFLCDGSGCQSIAQARGLFSDPRVVKHFMP